MALMLWIDGMMTHQWWHHDVTDAELGILTQQGFNHGRPQARGSSSASKRQQHLHPKNSIM
jgi:hypothetical protein